MTTNVNIKVGELMKQKVVIEDKLRHRGLQLERIKMPPFDGDIRDYPRFRAYFTQQVLPSIPGEKPTAYDDISEMWHRLDDKCGKPSKIVDVVIHDIEKIKAI